MAEKCRSRKCFHINASLPTKSKVSEFVMFNLYFNFSRKAHAHTHPNDAAIHTKECANLFYRFISFYLSLSGLLYKRSWLLATSWLNTQYWIPHLCSVCRARVLCVLIRKKIKKQKQRILSIATLFTRASALSFIHILRGTSEICIILSFFVC